MLETTWQISPMGPKIPPAMINMRGLLFTRVWTLLVDPASHRAHRENINEIIEFQTHPFVESPHFIKEKYLNEGLSASQIASYCRCSKTFILTRLRKFGIERRYGYTRQVPFGKKLIKSGAIIPYAKELKIAEQIVKMRKEGKSFKKIAQFFSDAKIRTRDWVHEFDNSFFDKLRDVCVILEGYPF